MVPTTPNCPTLVGKLADCPSTVAEVVLPADFLRRSVVEGVCSRLGGSWSRGCLAGGVETLARWFEGTKRLPGRAPDQQIFLQMVPRNAAGLVQVSYFMNTFTGYEEKSCVIMAWYLRSCCANRGADCMRMAKYTFNASIQEAKSPTHRLLAFFLPSCSPATGGHPNPPRSLGPKGNQN